MNVMTDVEVTKAFCAQLATRAGWTYRDDGSVYLASEVAVVYGTLGDTPDRGAGVTLYDGDDSVVNGLAVRWVQVRFRGPRGDRTGADELASQAFAVMQGLARVAGLSLVQRVIVAQLGTDENGRQERADSYQILLDNPEA